MTSLQAISFVVLWIGLSLALTGLWGLLCARGKR